LQYMKFFKVYSILTKVSVNCFPIICTIRIRYYIFLYTKQAWRWLYLFFFFFFIFPFFFFFLYISLFFWLRNLVMKLHKYCFIVLNYVEVRIYGYFNYLFYIYCLKKLEMSCLIFIYFDNKYSNNIFLRQ